jgi:hypothetical protein
MAEKFAGDARRMRRKAGDGLKLVVSLIPGLAADTAAFAKIVKAKSAREETSYLKLMQKHQRLRAALLALGSNE